MIALQELCNRKTAEGRGEWRLWCVVHDEALLLVPDTLTQQDVKTSRMSWSIRTFSETYRIKLTSR